MPSYNNGKAEIMVVIIFILFMPQKTRRLERNCLCVCHSTELHLLTYHYCRYDYFEDRNTRIPEGESEKLC